MDIWLHIVLTVGGGVVGMLIAEAIIAVINRVSR